MPPASRNPGAERNSPPPTEPLAPDADEQFLLAEDPVNFRTLVACELLPGAWRNWIGIVTTLAVVGMLAVTYNQLAPLPSPASILVLAVAFSAYSSGFISGVVSAFIAIGYCVIFFSTPGYLLRYTPRNLIHLLVVIVVVPVVALLVGILKLRDEQAHLERQKLLERQETVRTRIAALRHANQRMDEFLGIAAHELRTPLAGIKLNVQMIRRLGGLPQDDSERTAREMQAIARAEQQVARLERLTSDLVDASRIYEGRVSLRLATCDLNDVAGETVESLRLIWHGRTIAFTPLDAPLPIHADCERVAQVIANYLTNALKFSAENQPVAVSLTSDGTLARLEVRDQGIGVPADERAHIWERFYKVDAAEPQSGSGVGMGLGLYICRSLVTLHGGTTGMESAPDGGCIFWFTMPVVAIAAMPPARG